MNEFQEFIEAEMRRRDLDSYRKFAEFVNVHHGTIARIMSVSNPKLPSRGVLLKIANATGVDIRHIVGLVEPTGIKGVSADATTILAMINRLPKRKQEGLRVLIEAMLTEDADHEPKE